MQADVQPEYIASLRPDLVQNGGAPRHASPLPCLPDQARALDIGQRQRDRRLRQAGQPGKLGTGAAAELADVLQQQLLVQSAQQLRPGRLAVAQRTRRLTGSLTRELSGDLAGRRTGSLSGAPAAGLTGSLHRGPAASAPFTSGPRTVGR